MPVPESWTKQGLRPSDIVTMDSFENAIMVHAAISGSTNALLHLPAIAHEFGISIDGDTFDRLHRGAKYLLDIRPAGRWPAEFFYYAGGVPAIMEEIRDVLHLDAMTITGKTLGENLDELKANGFYEHCPQLLDEANARCGIKLTRADIIRPASDPIGTDGSIAILKGNLAPEGAVIKHTACPKEMFQAVLRARPFDSEEECLDAVLHHKVEKGDAVFIRYEGPHYYGVGNMDEDEDGRIIVSGEKKEDDILITIEDNGMGMPEEVLEKILTDNSKVPKHGSGVGVINVHSRIRLMFGEKYGLSIESEPDEGTRVTIRIPAIPYTPENAERLESQKYIQRRSADEKESG